MWALIGFSVLAVMGLGPLLVWWVVRRARRQPDLQWKSTGYRYHYTGHDEALAKRSATRAEAMLTRRLLNASERSMPLGQPLGQRTANVVEIRPRKVGT